MKNIIISIGPPFCNKSGYLNINFPKGDSIVISGNDIINKSYDEIQSLNLNSYKNIIVSGLNHTKQIRDLIINQINKYIKETYNIKYVYFDLSRHEILYDIFKKNKYKYTLPLYMYYDSIDLSDIDKNNLKIVRPNMGYKHLNEGCSALIINAKSFFIDSNNKISMDVPQSLKYVRFNNDLCDYVSIKNKEGLHIILSYCSDYKYDDINIDHIYRMFRAIRKHIDLYISGSMIDINNESCMFNKPHPWHLFKIINKFGISPQTTTYIGFGEHDRKFAHNAGIVNFIDCNNMTSVLREIHSSMCFV